MWRPVLGFVALASSACSSGLYSQAARSTMDNALGLYAGVLETSKEIPTPTKIQAAKIGVYIGEAFQREGNICTYYYTLEELKDLDIYDLTKAATYLQDGLRIICDLPQSGIDRSYE